MTITIPKGLSTLYYTEPTTVNLDLYKDFIYQVFRFSNLETFDIYIPNQPSFSEFNTLTPSLSYTFYALSEFEIVI